MKKKLGKKRKEVYWSQKKSHMLIWEGKQYCMLGSCCTIRWRFVGTGRQRLDYECQPIYISTKRTTLEIFASIPVSSILDQIHSISLPSYNKGRQLNFERVKRMLMKIVLIPIHLIVLTLLLEKKGEGALIKIWDYYIFNNSLNV